MGYTLRPNQLFINTPNEISLFLDGYRSIGRFELTYVNYYLVLIYSYFYQIADNSSEYIKYINDFFKSICLANNKIDL